MLSPKINVKKNFNLFELKDNNANLRSSNFLTTTMFGPNALSEFKKSIEAEKNLIKEIKNSRSLEKNSRNYEKSYKLQVQNLLEENNQLKIDIAMLKKNQSLGKIDINDKKSKEERNIEDYKIQLVSKDSLIKELEFQISDLSSESRLLKIVNDTQNQTINQLEQQLVQQRDLELILEESNEEIQKLKTLLQKDDLKQDNLKNQINSLQAELMSQKSRVYGNSLNNTIGDLTNVGENLLLYSFLEDSQEKFNNFNNFQGKLQKKLKKTLSHDLKGFNSQKILKNENYEKDVMIKLKNVNCPLAICEESKISEKTHKKSNLFERKLFRENENVKIQIEVEKFKLEQMKIKTENLLHFANSHLIQ